MSENDVQQLTSISKASTYEEIGEFWDTHSLADYWDQTYEVEFEVRIPRRHRVSIDAEAFDRITEVARHRGITSETLINLWIAERLRSLPAMPGKAVAREVERVGVEEAEKQLAEENEPYSAE
jgi:transposase-like protein